MTMPALRQTDPPNSPYARLLEPRIAELLPADIRSVGIDITAAGGILVGTRDAAGNGPRRMIVEADLPCWVDIELPGGRCITIEVSSYSSIAGREIDEEIREMEEQDRADDVWPRPIAVLCQTCPEPIAGWRERVRPIVGMGL